MNPDNVTEHCLSLSGTAEDFPFGDQPAVYRVGGKIFALLSEGLPGRVSMKLPPEEVTALKAMYPDTVLPGYHLNKRYWVTVVLNGGLPDEEVRELLEQSYDLVVQSLLRGAMT